MPPLLLIGRPMSHSFASRSSARAGLLALTLAVLSGAGWAGAPGLPGPSGAVANDHQISIMQDDDRLLYRSDATRVMTLETMKKLGVQAVRVTVLWNAVAGQARTTPARRRTFRADQPDTYPRGSWDRFDDLDEEATHLGISVYFDVTGPGPPWTRQQPVTHDKHAAKPWKPKPSDFYSFMVAVGRRYSGTAKDRAGRPIPRVGMWSIWNEPNQGGWLTPQWERVGGQLIPESPILYRSLYLYGRKALDASGHGSDFIMAGETAPIGVSRQTSTSAMAPAKFIRELFCVADNGQPYTGAAAAVRGCSIFGRLGPVRASAWAHHPYTKKVNPTTRDSEPGSITIANIADLSKLLDGLASTTGHLASGLPIMSSEFGYETNPPDPYFGMPLEQQAAWMNIGDFLAWEDPRVVGQAQLQLVDAGPVPHTPVHSRKHWATYQAGLYFLKGKPKPSLTAYALPFYAFPEGNNDANGHKVYGVWGQLRFDDGKISAQAPDQVQIEFRPSGSGAWVALGPTGTVTDPQGFFAGAIPIPGAGSLRARFFRPDVGQRISREVQVG